MKKEDIDKHLCNEVKTVVIFLSFLQRHEQILNCFLMIQKIFKIRKVVQVHSILYWVCILLDHAL